MATYAGRYSEDLQDRYGNGYRNALVAVQTLAAAPVTLYADRDKTAYVPAAGLAANEIKADSRGNLIFFADPGNYQIVVTPSGGSTLAAFPISVLPDPLEPDSSASDLAAHEADTANPHAVTKAQVGLSNVDNTSDANKPVSTAQGVALAAKADATALTTETTNRQNADTAHVGATDPHGDRAYTDASLAGLADSGWILPTLLTDVTAGSAWAHLGYRKVSGIVYIVVDLLIANPATAKHLFTLPAGFRWGPAGTTNQMGFIGISNSIRVRENGEVRAHAANASVTIALSYPAGG